MNGKVKIFWGVAIVILIAVGIWVFTQPTNSASEPKNDQTPIVKIDDKDQGELTKVATYPISGRQATIPQEDPGPVIDPEPEPEPSGPIAGLRTVKNFLMTALAPVGKVLWVTAGGFLDGDVGGDEAVRSIGLADSWVNFFNEKDADYDRAETDPPEDGKNVHHEKGLDSLSYVGWTFYNTLHSESLENDGYTFVPDQMVASLEEYCDFESASDLTGKTPSEIAGSLVPGDVAIMPGRHAYVVLGTCEDGSLVVAHAAWNVSTTGANGGGVQMSSVNEGGTEDCEAFQLADEYMEEYNPEWSERYDTMAKNTEGYMNFYDYAVDPEANGVLHWKDGVLEDPDGYLEMSAEEILADLYKQE